MKNLNPFTFKEEREFLEDSIVKPHNQIDTNELNRMLKRVFFKNVAQMVIGITAGLVIRALIKKKWPEDN